MIRWVKFYIDGQKLSFEINIKKEKNICFAKKSKIASFHLLNPKPNEIFL